MQMPKCHQKPPKVWENICIHKSCYHIQNTTKHIKTLCKFHELYCYCFSHELFLSLHNRWNHNLDSLDQATVQTLCVLIHNPSEINFYIHNMVLQYYGKFCWKSLEWIPYIAHLTGLTHRVSFMNLNFDLCFTIKVLYAVSNHIKHHITDNIIVKLWQLHA